MPLAASAVSAMSAVTLFGWVFVIISAAAGVTLVIAGVIEGMPSIMQWTFTRAMKRRQRS